MHLGTPVSMPGTGTKGKSTQGKKLIIEKKKVNLEANKVVSFVWNRSVC
jgi:hypothetical protein